MKKNKAIVVLLCILLVLIGVTYVDVFGVNPEGEGSMSDINLGLDLAGGVSITYQVVGDEDPSATDMSDTIAKLQKRVENYSTEAIVYQEGTDRINIEIPGVSDANAILQELGRPGTLYFIAQTDDQGNQNYSQQTVQNPDGTYGVGYVLTKTIDELLEDGSIQVQGTDVKEASAGSLQTNMGSEFAVSLTMTDEGAKKFAEVTQRAFDKNESLAIYYDGNIISAPGVNAVITDGSAQISPMESYERAENLASTIRIGGLRLELEELHSKVVGAQLGVEAIDTSLKAGAIGLALVIIFMIVVYLIPGLASGIALLCYVALVILLLNGFDMTLTLSGVAGIILSIGMAVDANVIIFARIREELASGKTVRNAIKIGFDKALSAIIDGNITTLIAAGVLLLLGPGTVKGFAQTLALGIVLSMFTALVVTRYLLYAFYALGLKSEKLYGVGKEPRTLAIVSRKGIFFGVSLAVIVAGFVVMGVHKASSGDALNYSLEFKGGTATTVTFSQAMTLEQANADVAPLIEEIAGSAVQIQTVQDSNEVIFKTSSLDVEQREALNEMFVDKFGVDEKLITSETISS
ncbi:MAG: protein translocase subunit SecD, partial [Lachnospiraceae bacterium]|nr:protein translocase subunit SecD [Lachnospiraceae bacterium]